MTTIFKLFSIFRISKIYLFVFFLLLYIGFEKGIIDQKDMTIIFQTVIDFCKFVFEQVTMHFNIDMFKGS